MKKRLENSDSCVGCIFRHTDDCHYEQENGNCPARDDDEEEERERTRKSKIYNEGEKHANK